MLIAWRDTRIFIQATRLLGIFSRLGFSVYFKKSPSPHVHIYSTLNYNSMKKPYAFLFCLIAVCLPGFVLGQGAFATHIQYNHQLGNLHEQGLDHGWGINGEYLTSPLYLSPGSAITLRPGIRFDFSSNGSTPSGRTFTDSDGEVFDTKINNSNFGGYAFLRISNDAGQLFQPYVDGALGFRWFISDEIVQGAPHSGDGCPGPEYNLPSLSSRVAPSWGSTLGLLVNLNSEISLDFRATYYNDGAASFVDLGSVESVKVDELTYSLGTARVNQLMLQVGVLLPLSGCIY